MATASLILGIIGICFAFVPVLNYIVVIPVIAGISLGIAELIINRNAGKPLALSIAGTSLNSLAMLGIILWTIFIYTEVEKYTTAVLGPDTMTEELQDYLEKRFSWRFGDNKSQEEKNLFTDKYPKPFDRDLSRRFNTNPFKIKPFKGDSNKSFDKESFQKHRELRESLEKRFDKLFNDDFFKKSSNKNKRTDKDTDKGSLNKKFNKDSNKGFSRKYEYKSPDGTQHFRWEYKSNEDPSASGNGSVKNFHWKFKSKPGENFSGKDADELIKHFKEQFQRHFELDSPGSSPKKQDKKIDKKKDSKLYEKRYNEII